MEGKNLEEVKAIKQRFIKRYWTSSIAQASCGIGRDDEGNYCLRVTLTRESDRSLLPSEFEGVKVLVTVGGPITKL